MLTRVTGNLCFIERGWLNANHFVFNGKSKVLIDTAYKKDLAHTLSLIQAAGLVPSAVDLIISTHSHCDHVGANRYIQELSGCAIAMHPTDRWHIEEKNSFATWWSYYDQEADFFTVTESLREGDTVNLDGLELEVIHTPGHAAGMIALYAPEHRFLISADAAWDGDFGAFTPRVEGLQAPTLQQQTLEKLGRLAVTTIYPGHGPVIYDALTAIDRCRQRLEKFLKEPEKMGRDQLKKLFIYCLLMKSGCGADSFYEYLMSTHWYRDTVDLYFPGRYRDVYDETVSGLLKKGLIARDGGLFKACVKA